VIKSIFGYLSLNPFLVTVAFLQLGGTVMFVQRGSLRMAIITFLYAVCNFVFASIK